MPSFGCFWCLFKALGLAKQPPEAVLACLGLGRRELLLPEGRWLHAGRRRAPLPTAADAEAAHGTPGAELGRGAAEPKGALTRNCYINLD